MAVNRDKTMLNRIHNHHHDHDQEPSRVMGCNETRPPPLTRMNTLNGEAAAAANPQKKGPSEATYP